MLEQERRQALLAWAGFAFHAEPFFGSALKETPGLELEAFDGEAELEMLASAVTRALRAEWSAIRQGLRRHRQSAGLTPDVAMGSKC